MLRFCKYFSFDKYPRLEIDLLTKKVNHKYIAKEVKYGIISDAKMRMISC